ncbi:MAG: phycobilisome rod-core linker polypeptide [Thermostichus sp. DG02_2_bins_29]
MHSHQQSRDPQALQNLLRAAYQQIFERQPYQHEKAGELEKIEQDFLRGRVGIKRLVRQLGGSHLYQQLFFSAGCNTRCVEQGFKHFLGRAPANKDEVATYHDILVHQGFQAMVNAFVDSEEYHRHFGNDRLPYPRQRLTGYPPVAYLLTDRMNHSHQLAMQGSPLLQSLAVM